MSVRSPSPTTSLSMSNASTTGPGESLRPGVYRILNNVEPNQTFDLSGYDSKTILAWPRHDGPNQQWEFCRLGPGYAIRSLCNGAYITLESGLSSGATLVATPYPVSWAVEADDWEAGIYRIRWPMSPYILDMPPYGTHGIQLSHRYPFKDRALWRLIPVERPKRLYTPDEPWADSWAENTPTRTRTRHTPSAQSEADQFELVTHAPLTSDTVKPGLETNAETVIDVEGLKLGGNGEMSITTTTTTVTTSVTMVKRIGMPPKN